MIAARPIAAESPPVVPQHFQENSESGGLLQNLFAGLSFPEVPTNVPSSSLTKEAVIHISSVTERESSTEIVDECKPSMKEKLEEQQIAHTAQSLASLYSSMDTTSLPARNYPDLPISIVSMTYSTTNQYEYTDTEQLTDVQYQGQEAPTIVESANHNAVEASADSCLVSDLIAENARLCSEVEQLKRSLLQSPPLALTVDGVSTRAPSSSDSISREQQEVMVRAEGDDERHGLLQQRTPDQSGVALKYVCCGGCRIWLSAPSDAVYVKCPGCNSINNCAAQVTEHYIRTLSKSSFS